MQVSQLKRKQSHLNIHNAGINGPLTPTSPTGPSILDKPKRANPLTDLVDSEKTFVDQLTGIIRVCR